MRLRLLTHSRAKCFRACNRRHYYGYELCYRALKMSEALFIGDIFHVCVHEVYWKARMSGCSSLEYATQAAMDTLRDRLHKAVTDGFSPFAAAKVVAMAICYTAAWNCRPDVQCLAVEQEFNSPLEFDGKRSSFWQMAGKIDRIMRLENGVVALGELKTSSADVGAASPYRRRLAMDEQISIYYEAAAWLGYPVETVMYEVVSKPRQVPYQATPEDQRKYTKEQSRLCKGCKNPKKHGPAPHIDEELNIECKGGRVVTDPGGKLYANMRERDETPDEYLERILKDAQETPGGLVTWIEVPRSDVQRKQFASIFKDTASLMRWSIEKNIHPPNSDACFHAGGSACEFIEVCEGTATLDDPMKFKKQEDGHSELSNREAMVDE